MDTVAARLAGHFDLYHSGDFDNAVELSIVASGAGAVEWSTLFAF